jgi:hypothetical protein
VVTTHLVQRDTELDGYLRRSLHVQSARCGHCTHVLTRASAARSRCASAKSSSS